MYRRDDGIVMIDPVKAKGQQQIVQACPYRVIFWNADLELPQKCTLCAHRLDAGDKQPRCSESCPTGAMVFGDLDDPASEISQRVAALETEALHPEFGCSPLVRYHGVPKRFVAGEVVLDDADDVCAAGVKVVLEGDGVRAETTSDAFGAVRVRGSGPEGLVPDLDRAPRVRCAGAGRTDRHRRLRRGRAPGPRPEHERSSSAADWPRAVTLIHQVGDPVRSRSPPGVHASIPDGR